jgi:uncharacterized protein with PQ loop repeat
MKKSIGELFYSASSMLFFIAILPQIVKMCKTKSTEDVSLSSLLVYLFTNTLLILTGILLKIRAMIIFGFMYIILNSLQTILKLKYSKSTIKKKNQKNGKIR